MKVLVVDDDVVSRMVLMHLVDSCGAYEIFEAEDGEDAWAQLAGGLRPAICFCDLRMPRLSGMALLARVNTEPALASMRFVLASSANDHATMAEASGLGAGGYLVKPFEQALVLAELAGLTPNATPDGESARATMARLGIDGARLLAYLGGFEQQLQAAAGELTVLLRTGQSEQVRARLGKLHAGCVTLGLESAAAPFAAFAAVDAFDVSAPAQLEAALRAALAAVAEKATAAALER
ncbi:response regulator [Massilia sp. DWR3-1-1]|uniref:response regulator n=1 Tax=Massilia sp. DWR3-1-1 TaxID=2804559 RepID=UPI003CF0331F